MELGILKFFNELSQAFNRSSVLGIDIGTSSLKIAEISKKSSWFRLENYGILETKNYLEYVNQAIQSTSLKISEKDASGLLKILLKEIKPKTNKAFIAIPAFSVFTTLLDMPTLSPKETEQAVMFQARQFIPLPPSEVSIDWLKVDEYENPRGGKYQHIILVGIPKEIIETYKKIVTMAGLKLVGLELESLALIRSLLSVDNQISLVIDIGALSTNAMIAENGALKYSSQTDHAGLYLTQALRRSLGVSMARAEDLKRRRGLLGQGGEFELSTLLLSFLDVIIGEANGVKDIYERRYGKKVQKVVLSGGGACMSGIEKYFEEQIGLPIYKPDVFWNVEYDFQLEPAKKLIQNEFAIAIGVAKRNFS